MLMPQKIPHHPEVDPVAPLPLRAARPVRPPEGRPQLRLKREIVVHPADRLPRATMSPQQLRPICPRRRILRPPAKLRRPQPLRLIPTPGQTQRPKELRTQPRPQSPMGLAQLRPRRFRRSARGRDQLRLRLRKIHRDRPLLGPEGMRGLRRPPVRLHPQAFAFQTPPAPRQPRPPTGRDQRLQPRARLRQRKHPGRLGHTRAGLGPIDDRLSCDARRHAQGYTKRGRGATGAAAQNISMDRNPSRMFLRMFI